MFWYIKEQFWSWHLVNGPCLCILRMGSACAVWVWGAYVYILNWLFCNGNLLYLHFLIYHEIFDHECFYRTLTGKFLTASVKYCGIYVPRLDGIVNKRARWVARKSNVVKQKSWFWETLHDERETVQCITQITHFNTISKIKFILIEFLTLKPFN